MVIKVRYRVDVSITHFQGLLYHFDDMLSFADVAHPTAYAYSGDGVAIVKFERRNGRGHGMAEERKVTCYHVASRLLDQIQSSPSKRNKGID